MNESISYLSESDQEIIKKKEIFSKSIIMVKIMTKKIFNHSIKYYKYLWMSATISK
jgi:hypothetical protein